MANLLRWSVGMALPKKKDENLNTNTPLINSLQTMNPIIISSNGINTVKNNGVNATNTLKPNTILGNAISRLEQASGQTVQQLAQRQQEEEAQRQQRIAEAQRQQERRRQEENERKLRQQQEQQQKQRNLLNSAGLGNNFMTTNEFRSKLEAQKQAKTQQPTKQEEPQYQIDSNLKEKYNNLFKDEGNGWSNNSYWTKYRSNGSTAYKYNPVYWESQQDLNRALRTITSKDENALGDADRIVSAYSKLSNDEKWSATQDLQKAANKIQQAMAKADNEGNVTARDSYGQALDYINTYQNLISGVKKGEKSFWKSLTDTAQSGGFVGDMARPFTNALGDLTGRTDASKRIEDDASIARAGNNGIVSALDSAAGTIGNIGLNVTTAGKYGLGTSAMNFAHEGVSAINDQDRQYYVDSDGKVQRQNRTNEEKFSNIGTAGFNMAMSMLGMAGLGPNIKFAGNQPLQSLIANENYGEIAKGLLKYAAKEVPFAIGTTTGETLVQAVGDKDAWSNYGKNLLNNIKGDVAMDIAGAVRYGKTGDRDMFRVNQDNGKLELDSSVKEQLSAEDNAKIQQRLDEFQEGVKQAVEQEGKARAEETKVEDNSKVGIDPGRVTTAEDGSAVKINNDGTATRLSDAEFARVIDQDTTPSKIVRGNTPFKDNSVDFRLSSDNVETLTKRALQGDTYAQRRLAELTNQNQAEETDWRGKSVEDVINPEGSEQKVKEAQFKTLQETNPMRDDYHTGIRSANEINTLGELVNKYNPDSMFTYPDFTIADARRAANKGEIEVFSSKPIEVGAFVTPSRMMAQDYAGSGEVYSKVIPIEDFAAIESGDEGNYLPRKAEIKTPSELNESPEIRVNPQEEIVNSELSSRIDKVLTDKNYRQPVLLRESTPDALVELGIKNLPMYENPSHIRNNILTEGEAKNAGVFRDGDNYHGLGKDIYMDAINGLDVPRAVFKRNDGSNDFMVLTAVKDSNGNTIIVPIEVETTTVANHIKIDTNRVKTLFGYDDNVGLNEYIKRNLKNNRFTKIDRGAAVITAAARSDTILPRSAEKVNANNPIMQYYQRYGDDFYEKMPWDLQTKYEELLDRQPRDGQGRYTDPITGETWIDEEASVNGKKSQFAENTSGNRNFSNETRVDLKSDPLTYKPTTNEERLTRANEILSTKSTDEIDNYLRENFFNVKPKDADSADMVLAGEYAKMLDARGQYDRSTEIINRMSEIGTKQGQNIQALSLMMNRSPEGIANMAQNAIKKAGGQMTGELRQEIVQRTQEIGRTRGERNKLAQENAKISEQIMNGKGDLKALRKRQMQIAQEYRLNLDQEGRQFSQLSDIVGKNSPDKRSVFGSIWRASLLSGPRTHTGNAVSNTFQNVLNASADRFASGLDWARSKITGTERQVVGSAGGRGKGLKRGLKAAGEVLKTGDNLWDSADMATGKVNAWGQGGEMEFKNKIANTMVAKPVNFIFRAMSSGDLPFRYTAFENAIRTEAKRQGVNLGYKGQALQDYINSRVATPDPELQAYGVRKGNESVYDADTILSKIVTSVDKMIETKVNNPVGKKIYETSKTLIMPFVKIPSKVLSTAIDYSPLGSVKSIVNKVANKNYTTAQFETDLAKSGLGTAGFVGLGYALSAAGLLTGGYPEDENERERWKAEGIEPNSIKIGDKYVSMNYLGPMGMLTAMGAGVQQRQAKGEDAFTIATGTLTDTMNSFLEQSYVQGLNNALNAVTDSKRYGESFGNSLARGLTPNLLRQTANATDPKQRQVNNAGEAIISGIPGLSQTLDAKVDAYGREIENKQTLPLGQMWDALKINNSRETNSVIDEVNRLHSVDPSNKELQITPTIQKNNISVNGTNIKITDAQKTQLQKDTGAAALKAMNQVMSSSNYKAMSDTEKAEALDKACKDAQKQARQQFIKANNITADNNPETRNSGGQINGDFSSKAISSAKSSGTNKKGISVNESLAKEHKDILDNYNSMSSEDWEKYVYGTNKDSASAEYRLALARYENDIANGDLTDTQKIKREKELRKLAVSQEWTKDYRDAYSLAGSKADMQDLLNQLDDKTRAKTVGILNGLNNAMYEAGVITASTYKTRANAINNTSSKKNKGKSKYGGITSAEASALSSLAKTMIKGGEGSKVKTTSAPNTKRKMTKTRSSGNKLAKYSTNLATNVTVSKNTKKGA